MLKRYIWLVWIFIAKPDLLSLLARVNTLHLVSVHISSFDTQEWLHLKSQSLENLIIEDCRGFRCLGIYTPQLKYLKVENSREEYNPSGLIEIDAPKLTSLVWKGYMYKDYIFSSPSSLVTVEVDTKINSVDEHEHLNTDSSMKMKMSMSMKLIPSPM
ncbi:hypothetical protein IFM89_027142 [Coptis chinensis]|uniref:At1g61320/AtMIF1 LRR domain-containing protein n=1 Tax=Coptis chinensis TaxID=261450 RepID=A0A835I645_9MAGN|nr:hypothetical protein IFM89_027142 [Coptis chinensis]